MYKVNFVKRKKNCTKIFPSLESAVCFMNKIMQHTETKVIMTFCER